MAADRLLFRRGRNALGLTQSAMAEALGCATYRTVARWETAATSAAR